jgi:hypothetical protein
VGYSDGVLTARPGAVTRPLDIPRAGVWALWLEGSLGRAAVLSVDGRAAGRVAPELGFRQQYRRAGSIRLAAGAHQVRLELAPGAVLKPGAAGRIRRWVGSIAAAPAGPTERRARIIAPADTNALCGRSLDWIEVVR